MKKLLSMYLHFALSVIIGFSAVRVTSQNEIIFPTDSIISKTPVYLLNVSDKGNGILEAKYITYLDCIIKAADEKLATGEVVGSDNKIIKYSNKLMALIIQPINLKGERAGASKIIKIALRNLKPDVEYVIKPRIDSDLSMLGNSMKPDYGQNTYETIPGLTVDEIAQLKEIYTQLYKKGTFKNYYTDNKVVKSETTEALENPTDIKPPKFSKAEKLIKSKELDENEAYYFTQTKKTDTKGKLIKIYNRKDTAAPLVIIDSLFFTEEAAAELEEIEYVHDLSKNKQCGLLLLFRTFSKTGKGFETVYVGFDNKIKRSALKKEDNKLKNFALKTIYKDSNNVVLINFKSASANGEYQVHILNNDSLFLASTIDAADTTIIKKYAAHDLAWKNDDGYNSKMIFNKKINSSLIILEQSDLLETSSGMIPTDGYIPNNFNRGYCHTNLFIIKENKIVKKYNLYTDYFKSKPVGFRSVCEENGEHTLFLDMPNKVLVKFNENEVLAFKSVENANERLFKSPVTKKYYFDYMGEKYYYFNDPVKNKIFLKKIS
ncbi:MAG: hypothetical protein ABIP51_02040 [Bacteroidia bacterium]